MSYIGNTPGVSSQRVVTEEVISGSPKSAFYPVGGYSLGYVDVLVNGLEVDTSDFTATDGVLVTLGTAAAVGDTVKIKCYLPRGLSDGYLKTEADARYPRVDVNTQGLNSTQKGNARTNIGAQADLGYTPVNKAGDTITGTVQMAAGNQIRLMNSNNTNWASIDCPSTDGTGQLRLNVGAGAAALFDNSGNMSLPLGNLSLANGKGIDFSATGNSTGTVNSELFDDYERGAFTPTLQAGYSSAPSVTGGGWYTKIGNLVTFSFDVAVSGGTKGSTQVKFGGLPFTAWPNSHGYGFAWFNYNDGFKADNAISFHITASDTTVAVYDTNGAGMLGTAITRSTWSVQMNGFFYTA